MMVTSIQTVYSLTPLYTQQEVYRTLVDEKTHKAIQEIITYRTYNRRAEIEENHQPRIDLRA